MPEPTQSERGQRHRARARRALPHGQPNTITSSTPNSVAKPVLLLHCHNVKLAKLPTQAKSKQTTNRLKENAILRGFLTCICRCLTSRHMVQVLFCQKTLFWRIPPRFLVQQCQIANDHLRSVELTNVIIQSGLQLLGVNASHQERQILPQ